jgi:hypothetical protein
VASEAALWPEKQPYGEKRPHGQHSRYPGRSVPPPHTPTSTAALR